MKANRAKVDEDAQRQNPKLWGAIIFIGVCIWILVAGQGGGGAAKSTGFDAVRDGMTEDEVSLKWRKPDKFTPEWGPKPDKCGSGHMPSAWAWVYEKHIDVVQFCDHIVVGKGQIADPTPQFGSR